MTTNISSPICAYSMLKPKTGSASCAFWDAAHRRRIGRPAHRRTLFFHSSIKASILLPADLEDHASTRDLHQRCICRIDKTGVAAGAAAGVPHRAVIDDIGTAVWPEPDISRPVERGGVAGRNECLFAARVEREIP